MTKDSALKKPSWLAMGVLVLLPIIGVVWFGFVSVAPLSADNFWHDSVIADKNSFVYTIVLALHILGSTKGMAVVSAIILVISLVLKKWAHALVISTTMLSVLLASKLLKMLVDRPRPVDMLIAETETSFPSGHSLGAGAIATVLVCFVYASSKSNTSARIFATFFGVIYILAMMWSRTALHVHWLSDTIAGALLGICIALLFSRLFLFRDTPLTTRKGRYAR